MKLFATVAYYGNKEFEEVQEIRLAIHDALENIVHTEYWSTEDQLTEDEVTDDIIKTCERFSVQQIFTINKLLEPEFCEECNERIFRTTKAMDFLKKGSKKNNRR
ncbi:MAG: hypothetical protein ACFFCD_11190 [Promethearchaeota archaeon]